MVKNPIGKYLTVLIILLFIGVPFLSISICSARPINYYFENVNVLIYGRCGSIGSSNYPGDHLWEPPLFIGTLTSAWVQTTGKLTEGIHVIIFNESISEPWLVLKGLKNHVVFMKGNVEGIFFWSSFTSYPVRLILSCTVIVHCHTDKVWIKNN